MSVLSRLADALDRRDERPNVELAEAIVDQPDPAPAMAELVAALRNPSLAIQNDAIKVLYEIGDRRPALLAPYLEDLLALLESPNNRNVWGAMQAIDTIAATRPRDIHAALPAILEAADTSSVIAHDKAMSILATLAASGLAESVVPIMVARLRTAAVNQLPMYAEWCGPVMTPASRPEFVTVLMARLLDIDQQSKRDRIEAVLRKLKH